MLPALNGLNIMPELPEVETLCRQLRQCILNEKIVDTIVLDSRIKDIPDLKSARIMEISRHGKWFGITLSTGIVLRFHLRMTGRLHHGSAAGSGHPKHARFQIRFRTSSIYLIDPRRFATLEQERPGGKDLPGCDALNPPSSETLFRAARNRSVSIKTFLLDQKVIAGIGNIYACEILYTSGIDPVKQASCLGRREWKKLLEVMKNVLAEAVRCRGTSVSDWRDLYGMPGEYQNLLHVYGKEGISCPRCGEAILRINQNGRSTFYCPACQK